MRINPDPHNPNPMKQFLIWCLALTLQASASSAQELSAQSVSDPLWQQATAGGALDLRVFGRAARDVRNYDNLASRFEAADTTLVLGDLLTLYYGAAYRDGYDGGYDRAVSRREKERDPERAYRRCTEALALHPASPGILGDAIDLAERTQRPKEEIERLQWRRRMLLWAIYALGDGSQEHPYIVMAVSDEYQMMYHLLGVGRVVDQSLVRSADATPCDRIKIDGCDTALFNGTEIWFDVSYPIVMLSRPKHWAKRLEAEKGQ